MSLLSASNQHKTSVPGKRFFAPHPDIDNQIDQLLKVIDLRKNGMTVEQQENRGIRYRLNYGVALAHIKEIAKTISPSNELAMRLWYREVRETMILATLVANPLQLEKSDVIQWCSLISNPELAEQMSMNLLGKMPSIGDIAPQLMQSNNNNVKATAFFSLGWALRNELIEPSDIKPYFQELYSSTVAFTAIEKRGISHLVRQLARKGTDGLEIANQWLIQAEQNASPEWNSIIDEVKAELDWLNETH